MNNILNLHYNHGEVVGEVRFQEPEDFSLMLDELGINLITGMKGSGKSYLAKKILLRLIDHGKVTIVFDVNGEYIDLWKAKANPRPGKYYERIEILDPQLAQAQTKSVPFRIPLHEVDYDEFAEMVNIGSDTNMYNVLIQFWNSQTHFDLDDFENWLKETEEINEWSRTGLLGKIKTAKSFGLFGPGKFKNKIKKLEKTGGALIVNLKGENRPRRQMIVEYIMNHLRHLRKSNEINPISVFTEEAQLYITESLWDDILTRMRHYGIFPTFITNDPRTLPDEVYSLCDNLIAFSFHNSDDLRQLSKAKFIDVDTLKLLQSIEFQSALMIGDITHEFPIIVDVYPEEEVRMGGETEELF